MIVFTEWRNRKIMMISEEGYPFKFKFGQAKARQMVKYYEDIKRFAEEVIDKPEEVEPPNGTDGGEPGGEPGVELSAIEGSVPTVGV